MNRRVVFHRVSGIPARQSARRVAVAVAVVLVAGMAYSVYERNRRGAALRKAFPMSNRKNWIVALGVLACFAWLNAGLAKAHGADALPSLAAVELVDLAGKKHKLAGSPEVKLSVLVFLGTQCPVSNGYAPALRRLHDSYTNAGVRILGVHCDPDVSAQAAQAHARDFELSFPLVLDHQPSFFLSLLIYFLVKV
jgi:hypothetical protein